MLDVNGDALTNIFSWLQYYCTANQQDSIENFQEITPYSVTVLKICSMCRKWAVCGQNTDIFCLFFYLFQVRHFFLHVFKYVQFPCQNNCIPKQILNIPLSFRNCTTVLQQWSNNSILGSGSSQAAVISLVSYWNVTDNLSWSWGVKSKWFPTPSRSKNKELTLSQSDTAADDM